MHPLSLLLPLWPLALGAGAVGALWLLWAGLRRWRGRALAAEARARAAEEALALAAAVAEGWGAVERETQARLARLRRAGEEVEDELREAKSPEEVAELANRWFGVSPPLSPRLRRGEGGGAPPGAAPTGTPPGGEPPPKT